MKRLILMLILISVALLTFSVFAGNLKYNQFEDRWEFTNPDDNLRYNQFENKWSYESPDAKLKYNSFENTWVWDD